LGIEHEDGDGWPQLVAAVDAGFRQPDLLPVAETFANHDGWEALNHRMASAAPAPDPELAEWPTVTYGPQLVLDSVPEASGDRLLARLPGVKASAWDTAVMLLEWATTRWEHANDHVDDQNAAEVLDRVEGGERFACVEYSIVLSQALNAVGIPARRVNLRTPDSHVGFGRGHVVTEAWIDDLNKWVILDGQNGAWWGTKTDPLGWNDLVSQPEHDAARPDMVTTAREMTGEDMDMWWTYFDTAVSSGMTWSRPFSPFFQQEPVSVRLLASPSAVVHPDLSQLETSLVDLGYGPGVAFWPTHPYATGVRVGDILVSPHEPVLLADALADRSRVQVATVTAYSNLAPHALVTTGRT